MQEYGPELSLAFGNRSAGKYTFDFLKNFKLIINIFFEIFTALYHAGQYEDCLKDIELALKYRYPKNLEYKLHQRRGQCLTQIGQHLEARNAFNQAMSALDLVKNIK